MVGQGALAECLAADDVEEVLTVVRAATGTAHPKVREIVHRDFLDFAPLAPSLAGYDACFFCLGVSSAGMSEVDYRRITYDYTLAAARVLVERSPQLVFVYVSGEGTANAPGRGSMWARVKGDTERALLGLPFKKAYMFRPGYIQPLNGIRSKTPLYQAAYRVVGPLFPLIKRLAPNHVTTTQLVGRAMLEVVRHGTPNPIVESRNINQLGGVGARGGGR